MKTFIKKMYAVPLFIYEFILLFIFYMTMPCRKSEKYILNYGSNRVKLYYYYSKIVATTPDKNNSWKLISYCTKGLKLYKQQKAIIAAAEILYTYRAIAKYLIKDYQGAMRDCKRALKYDDTYACTYFVIALLHDIKKEYNKEIETYNKIIGLGKNQYTAAAYFNRAMVNNSLEKFDKCKQDLYSTIKESPKYLAAYYERAQYYYNNTDFTEFAMNDLNTITNISNDYADAYALKALILIDKQKYNEAIELLKKAEYTCNKKELIYNALSYIYFIKGNYKKSLSYADRAILYNKDCGTSYYRKAQALISLGRYKNAGRFMKKANELEYCEIF